MRLSSKLFEIEWYANTSGREYDIPRKWAVKTDVILKSTRRKKKIISFRWRFLISLTHHGRVSNIVEIFSAVKGGCFLKALFVFAQRDFPPHLSTIFITETRIYIKVHERTFFLDGGGNAAHPNALIKCKHFLLVLKISLFLLLFPSAKATGNTRRELQEF